MVDERVLRQEPPDWSPIGAVAILTRRRRIVTACFVAVVAATAGITLLTPRTFTSSVLFVPSGEDAGGARLSGLAAQFGLSVPSSPGAIAPAALAELVRSRQVLESVAGKRYRVGVGRERRSGSLATVAGISRGDSVLDRERAIRWLRDKAVEAWYDRVEGSGLVTVEVRARVAELAAQVAAAVLDATDSATQASRRRQAVATKDFIRPRLDSMLAELALAENRVQRFLERNRDFRNSPQLVFEYERLQRELSIREGVVLTLSQSFEQARIDEHRDTPAIRVLQPPTRPILPDPRRLPLKLLLAVVVGLVFGSSAAFGVEWVQALVANDPASAAIIRRHMRELLEDARRLLRYPRRVRPDGL